MAYPGRECPGQEASMTLPAWTLTEAQWKSTDNPGWLSRFIRDKASPRKARLLECACFRLVWLKLPDSGQRAVEVAERYADGLASLQALQAAHEAAEVA